MCRNCRLCRKFLPLLSIWVKNLDPEIILSPSIKAFTNELSSLLGPPAEPIVSVYDPIGLAILMQLSVSLSKLNCHKFRHNFKDTMDSMCSMNDDIEVQSICLLSFHLYDVQRYDLLGTVHAILHTSDLLNLSREMWLKVLLHGDERLSICSDSQIIKATLTYIHVSQRCS